ncbi:MAG: SMI1/KNR4 family protein [Acidimicrobiales bacterium]
MRNVKTHEIVPARCRITPSWTTEQDAWFLGLLARSELPLGSPSGDSRIWHPARVAGCDDRQLADAEARLNVTLPGALKAMYLAADGRFNVDGQWWVVWPLERLVADTLQRWSEGMLDLSLVAFGDDGTGDPFCVDSGGESPVVRWSVIDAEIEEELSFDRFAIEWLKS